MIIWLSSYPKSGNTYIRSFLSAYYFSKDGNFNFNLLLNINQFPGIHFSKNKMDSKLEASKNWILNQNIYFDKNKLKILKTHNSLTPYEQNKFTSKDQTLGAIYICRDPRNIITSLKNHYSMDYDKALNFMLNDSSSLTQNSIDKDFSNFTFLGSWTNHYKSWKNNKIFPTMFIRYEDLQDNKFEIFKEIILFINNLSKNNDSIDEKKLLNSVNSTNFINLKNKEQREGFEESIISKKTGKKIIFFNMGFNNRWQKILPEEIKIKTNKVFKEDLKVLNY